MALQTGFSHEFRIVIVLLAGLCIVPFVVHSPYVLHLFILTMLYAMLAGSWNLMNGYTGLFTFGHQAFFGIGAYGSALIAMNTGLSPWITLWFGGLLSALAGLIIGLPVLRIRSTAHVAIITLAFAAIVETIVSNWTDFTRGTLGLGGIPPFTAFSLPVIGMINFDEGDHVAYYWVALALMFLSAVLLVWLTGSRTGLALKAIRDSEMAADSLGINPTRYKLLAFLVSSFIAGIAGAYYAHYLQILTPDSAIGVPIMISILVITLIGGIGTNIGPIAGAFLVIFGLEGMRGLGDYRLMVYGIILVLFVIFMPHGLARLWQRSVNSKLPHTATELSAIGQNLDKETTAG